MRARFALTHARLLKVRKQRAPEVSIISQPKRQKNVIVTSSPGCGLAAWVELETKVRHCYVISRLRPGSS